MKSSEDPTAGGCKANSCIFHQPVEKECYDIVEGPAPFQIEVQTTDSLLTH
jgi:hypothetical protein